MASRLGRLNLLLLLVNPALLWHTALAVAAGFTWFDAIQAWAVRLLQLVLEGRVNHTLQFVVRVFSTLALLLIAKLPGLVRALHQGQQQQQQLTPPPAAGLVARIRLLRLSPVISSGFSEIRGSLEEVELSEDPCVPSVCAYTAVSYCWGDPSPKRSIFVDGRQRFWIDQICIKQDDIQDKEEQIPLMATIYRKSLRLIIWLGVAGEDGSLAVNTVDGSASVPSPAAKQALLGLLRNPWFTRTWVVQEVTMGTGMGWLTDQGTIAYGGPVSLDDLTGGDTALAAIFRMIRIGRFDASVSKDRIYAVLALCGLPSWVPNWTVTPAAATTPWVELSGIAELIDPRVGGIHWELAQVYSYGKIDWVHADDRPRFRGANASLKAKEAAFMAVLDLAGPAIPATVQDIEIFDEDKLLVVHGRRIDRLRAVSCVMDTTAATAAAILRLWLQLARSNMDVYPYREEEQSRLLAPFLRTLCTDLSCDWTDLVDIQCLQRPMPDDMLAAVGWYVSQTEDQTEYQTEDRTEESPPTHYKHKAPPPPPPPPLEMTEHVKRLVTSTCIGRMFGVTEKGYYGLFPRGSRAADLVCLFNGSPVPFCLPRPTERTERALCGALVLCEQSTLGPQSVETEEEL
ncbi:heterokaryon incompatibility protein-domain-containing protein [Lasiosphaeria miniovina]|uniref:Heterokaryon incompatibility protein-domain-containing protein n=1 Tax=Lasiosphaeria miniovina TaxID=1954250 RepID=A0AA40E6C7_9PEZI|nr:heterokaryon incompatibility protein-domain-containing protein [Lasiosphaeria miniovina]KAK0726697.1 heterokaryon incompatibility protein-domain-containing protein [Lasiosphaeria miniovina]